MAVLQSVADVLPLATCEASCVRRKSRTILTVLGLAVGVSLVIAVSSLSRGLDEAQAKALDPLSSIGTDLTVTLEPRGQDEDRADSAVAAVRRQRP